MPFLERCCKCTRSVSLKLRFSSSFSFCSRRHHPYRLHCHCRYHLNCPSSLLCRRVLCVCVCVCVLCITTKEEKGENKKSLISHSHPSLTSLTSMSMAGLVAPSISSIMTQFGLWSDATTCFIQKKGESQAGEKEDKVICLKNPRFLAFLFKNSRFAFESRSESAFA